MKKNYVLDTNVLLHDPRSVLRFEDNNVFIPIYVIEEVDKFKHEGTERGRNAREILRILDGLRASKGTLSSGVPLESGGTLEVVVPKSRPMLPSAIDPTTMDAVILQTAFEVRSRNIGIPTVFVTMDTNLRIRSDVLGLVSETYENQRVPSEHREESGVIEVFVPGEAVDAFFEEGSLTPEQEIPSNTCVLLRSESNSTQTALGRYDSRSGKVLPLRVPRDGILGIRPRNREQSFALDLLLDERVQLVTISGKAGCGKTMLALLAGLRQTIDDGRYSRVLVSRPVIPMGRDIGYLPGSIEEKMGPWMQPVFDNLEFIFSSGLKRNGHGYVELLESGQLQVEPLTYIRGRSLPGQYMIVDECQNLTPHEIKTIISRAGEGTKIVLTGDPAQIDTPHLDSQSNGLSVVAERFRGNRISGHITLSRGERSELAELAAALL